MAERGQAEAGSCRRGTVASRTARPASEPRPGNNERPSLDDGAQIDLLLRDPVYGEVQLWGRVVRTKPPHRTLASVEPGEVGGGVESTSENFFRIVTRSGDD